MFVDQRVKNGGSYGKFCLYTQQDRCKFGRVTHEKGHNVHIFFIEDGTLWADNTRDFTEKTLTGDCPGDYFPYLLENEIPIGV